jgi:hypothetical protein
MINKDTLGYGCRSSTEKRKGANSNEIVFQLTKYSYVHIMSYYDHNRETIKFNNLTNYYSNRKQILEKKRIKYRKNKALPFGRSYLDLLPEHVTDIIFKMLHQCRFSRTLELINMLRYKYENHHIHTLLSFKQLYYQLPCKTVQVDLDSCLAFIPRCLNCISHVRLKYDVDIRFFGVNGEQRFYDKIFLKWKGCHRYLRVIDIINVLIDLNVQSIPNHDIMINTYNMYRPHRQYLIMWFSFDHSDEYVGSSDEEF